jgi:hypothetical protein
MSRRAIAALIAGLLTLTSVGIAPDASAGGITTTYTECRTNALGRVSDCRTNTIDWGGAGEDPTVSYGPWTPVEDIE